MAYFDSVSIYFTHTNVDNLADFFFLIITEMTMASTTNTITSDQLY